LVYLLPINYRPLPGNIQPGGTSGKRSKRLEISSKNWSQARQLVASFKHFVDNPLHGYFFYARFRLKVTG
jgi:hypothetical protein